MQHAKTTHFTEQGFNITGIIHGGANDGEEVVAYKIYGYYPILAFEPLSKAADIFRGNHPDIPLIQAGLHDVDGEGELNICVGDGKGSSLFDPILDHEEVMRNWNQGQAMFEGTETIKLMRLDTFFAENPEYKIEDYNCLVLDTQGNEYEILEGCGDLIHNFELICVELSTVPVYEGEHPGDEVVELLRRKGFTQDTPVVSHNDVFFVRSDLKPTSDLRYYGLA